MLKYFIFVELATERVTRIHNFNVNGEKKMKLNDFCQFGHEWCYIHSVKIMCLSTMGLSFKNIRMKKIARINTFYEKFFTHSTLSRHIFFSTICIWFMQKLRCSTNLSAYLLLLTRSFKNKVGKNKWKTVWLFFFFKLCCQQNIKQWQVVRYGASIDKTAMKMVQTKWCSSFVSLIDRLTLISRWFPLLLWWISFAILTVSEYVHVFSQFDVMHSVFGMIVYSQRIDSIKKRKYGKKRFQGIFECDTWNVTTTTTTKAFLKKTLGTIIGVLTQNNTLLAMKR